MKNLLKRKATILILLILLLSAFLRLYRIGDYMTFLGDEGRDVLIVKGILEGNFTLLGPRSSAGDFYTGPIYYYMMAPFLWLFNYDPVGPAVMIALLGIATVYLVYYVGKKLFSEPVGLIAAGVYAVSPLVINYAHSSWNPNPMPFITLLMLYLLYNAVQKPSWKQFFSIGILYGIALQLHYAELFVGIIMACFMLFAFFYQKRKVIIDLIKQYVWLFLGFLVGFSPFLAFEVRHGFPNIRTILNFIVHGDPTSTDNTNDPFLSIVGNVFFRLFARLLWHFPPPDQYGSWEGITFMLAIAFILVTAIITVIIFLKQKNKLVLALFGLWLFFGVVLFGFYKKPINDYNFEFMFPLPFFLTANLLVYVYENKKLKLIGKGVAIIFVAYLFLYNLRYNPFIAEPNKQKNQMETIAKFVLSKTDNQPYNFALLAQGNSDFAYRYFFSVAHKDPVTIQNTQVDPERKTVTKQLLVVCEQMDCQPQGNSLWEVAGFGPADIAGQWNVSVVKVYKLVHTANR